MNVADRLTLDPVTSSPGVARRWVAERLAEVPSHVVETATLLTSELVTNSVLHAQTELVVGVERDGGRIRIEVADLNTTVPSPRRYGDYAMTGRGLALIEAMSSSWGVEAGPGGKVVYFDLLISDAPALPAVDLDAWPDLEAWPEVDDPPDLAADLVAVALLGIPLPALRRASEQYDALAREFRLILDQSPDERTEVPGRLLSLMEDLNGRFASFTDPTNVELQAALDRGDDSIDVTYDVPRAIGPITLEYDALLDEADAYCRAGALLTLAADDEAVALRKWFLLEFVAQAAGRPATPWATSAWALSLSGRDRR